MTARGNSAGSPPVVAQWLALLIPALALGGAYYTQYVWGLFPCEMCWWQRYPHFVALPLALMGFILPPRHLWVALAALAILTSGLIGGFHAGVEYKWWEGVTACATISAKGVDPLEAIMNAPLVRCDEAAWTLGGISLAGFNFLFSTAGAIAILVLLARRKRA